MSKALLNNFTINVLIGHLDRVFNDTGKVPKTVSVTMPAYRNLLVELGRSTIYDFPVVNTNLPRILTIQSTGGETTVLFDREMPEGMDFYFGDGEEEKMRWLDRLAEDILLRETP